jgi:hypothetical protein
MKLPVNLAFVSCLAVGATVMILPNTARAWYSFENTSICAYQPGTQSSSLAWGSAGWTSQVTTLQNIFCPLSDTSSTPIHSSNGLWLYGWKGNSSSSASYNVSAHVCIQYWDIAGSTCGTVSNTNGLSPGTFELGVDTSVLNSSDDAAYIYVAMGANTTLNSYWLQGN